MTSKQIEAGMTCGDCQVINTAPYGVRLCSKHGAVDELIAIARAVCTTKSQIRQLPSGVSFERIRCSQCNSYWDINHAGRRDEEEHHKDTCLSNAARAALTKGTQQ